MPAQHTRPRVRPLRSFSVQLTRASRLARSSCARFLGPKPQTYYDLDDPASPFYGAPLRYAEHRATCTSRSACANTPSQVEGPFSFGVVFGIALSNIEGKRSAR